MRLNLLTLTLYLNVTGVRFNNRKKTKLFYSEVMFFKKTWSVKKYFFKGCPRVNHHSKLERLRVGKVTPENSLTI